ncbi:MAG: carbamate kinase [Hyphomicrobiaceae bacterium]|nr:MAG: carbamate kinase [Hyphomicrobiaceae bacterium]
MRIVIALGGNALLRRGEPMTPQTQRANVKRAVAALLPLLEGGHQLVITHGNGPQVGLLALQAAAGPREGTYPLDILDAESEGMVGYLIEQELSNVLPGGRLIATLLTQVLVDRRDKAFSHPTKPIGPVYDKAEAERLAQVSGWRIAGEGGGWRRVVASPRPLQVLEARVIELLVSQGVIVICTGGGGIPVVERSDGTLVGVEAVIDKDLASALLASQLRADHLMLLTDVDSVYLHWGTDAARPVARAGTRALTAADFAPGSMGPKIEAAIGFAAETGRPASIGRLEDAALIVAGAAGTRIDAATTSVTLRAPG